jgi:hypothetical protein
MPPDRIEVNAASEKFHNNVPEFAMRVVVGEFYKQTPKLRIGRCRGEADPTT